MPFDWGSASADEVRAEARRRADRRAQGLRLHAEEDQHDLTTARARLREIEADPALLISGDALQKRLTRLTGEEVAAEPASRRRVVLPWSLLVSDNAKYAPALRRGGQAAIILGREYRHAKRGGAALVRAQLGSAPALTGPLALTATFIEPGRHGRDIANYAKLVHDVLRGIVYLDDRQLDRVDWRRGAPDIDHPRLEITVEEIPLASFSAWE